MCSTLRVYWSAPYGLNRGIPASAEAVEEEASAPVVVRTGGRGEVAEGEPVGDVGVVEVASGEVPAKHSGVVTPANQVGGGVGGCLGEGDELPGIRIGHEQGVNLTLASD